MMDYYGDNDFDDSDEVSSGDFEDDSSYLDSDESEFDFENAYLTNNDCYPPDKKTPNIVEYAGKGYLSLVQREAKGMKADVINSSRKWTEVEEKWGYDKSWEWHDDTPLIAAARSGHLEIVMYLLSIGADPTLESCHVCDENGNASKAALGGMQSLIRKKDQIFQGKNCLYALESTDPEIVALDIIYRTNEFQNIIDVMKVADPYWNKASYASSSFSKERKVKFEKNPNKPTNEKELKSKLDEFTPTPPDIGQLKDLASAVIQMRRKKETQQSSIVNSVFKQLSINNHCAISTNCPGNPPARDCQHKCCGKCCPGPCQRHKLKSKRDSNGSKPSKINVVPYNPYMKSYSCENIDAFIQQCTEWDEERTEEYFLPTSEKIRSVVKKKVFGENHYITVTLVHAFGVLIEKHRSLRNGNSSISGTFGNFNDVSKSLTTTKLCRKVDHFKDKRRRMITLKPIIEKVFAEGYVYPMVKKDLSLKVLVTDMVSFGDLKDAQCQKLQEQEIDGKITRYINTVRPFKPGYYHASIVRPMKDCDPFMMYHHESVDPLKLMQQILLMADDYDAYLPDVRNSINRYDWCERMYDGGESSGEGGSEIDPDREEAGKFEERCAIYFCPTESGPLLKDATKQNKSTKSKFIEELSGYHDNDRTFALGTKVSEMNSGDWIYGKVFEDIDSGQNFALVVNFCLGDLFQETIPEELKQYPDIKFTSVNQTKLRFDVADFAKENV